MRAARFIAIVAISLLGFAPSTRAASLDVQVDPAQPSVGTPLTLDIAVVDGHPTHVALPNVPGLRIMPDPTSTMSYAFSNGILTTTTTSKYQVVADQAGDFTIPSFDITSNGGTILRSQPLTVHVADAQPAATDAIPANTGGSSVGPTPPPPDDSSATAADNGLSDTIPRDADGGPAKVFMLIKPETTNAYVGQAVRVRIDFLIRMEVNAVQDSLPTIQGTNFLMNDFSVRGHEAVMFIENEQYEVDSFFSAITAPKAGNFPLASERDTYWLKSISPDSFDALGLARTKNLGHGMITSNRLMMHILPLPTEGRPANFTGAIGEFNVSGEARPEGVGGGEPVTVTFNVTGVGNFDYVRCPVLGPTTEWKTYAPEAQTSFEDEEHTRATKVFQQALIARKNGYVPLPTASFAYFDPGTRQYVQAPITLPSVEVTGLVPNSATSPYAAAGIESTLPPPTADTLLPNRAELGDLVTSLTPAYRRAWFWTAQGMLAALPLLGLLVFALWRQSGTDRAAVTAKRVRFEKEDVAMADAINRNDSAAFFRAARRAIQLQLGARWRIAAEAITLAEIRQRDPALADQLREFFAAADEALYSARPPAQGDLAHWASFVRGILALDSKP